MFQAEYTTSDISWALSKAYPRRLAAFLVLSMYMLTSLFFSLRLSSTQLLPGKYLLLLAAVMGLIGLGMSWLVSGEGARRWIGTALMVLVCVLMGSGLSYIDETMNTVRVITTVSSETAAMGIYVRADGGLDEQVFQSEAGKLTYGVMAQLDRENTDAVLNKLRVDFGTEFKVKDYAGVKDLFDGLMAEETDAIVINRAYLGILADIEGYADAESRLKEVQLTQVYQSPEPAKPERENSGTPPPQADGSAQPEQDSRVFTVFLSGSDTEGELSDSTRSDVNILAVINPDTRQVALISTPRDYYVTLPVSGDAKDKLTHAGIYGVDVSMETISALYGVDVDYYFRVNFNGFIDIVDALGGVVVDSELDFSIDRYDFLAGPNYVDGRAALMFVRERKSFVDGDIQRGKNQLALLKALIKRAMSPDLLLNYTTVLDALEGSFETSIPYDLLSELIRGQLSSGGEWNLVSYSVSGIGDYQVPYSLGTEAYVMIPDESTVAAAKDLIAQVRAGEKLGG